VDVKYFKGAANADVYPYYIGNYMGRDALLADLTGRHALYTYRFNFHSTVVGAIKVLRLDLERHPNETARSSSLTGTAT
jgi:hypothetical protein